MPIYTYQCPKGHRQERFRKITARRRPVPCNRCTAKAQLVLTRTHCPPDGVYSYAPNLGDPARFERQREALRTGKKVIERE
ncbi:MAG: zinc ribbon domain-containing protein [Gemmatimonadetes bacterium]|nr:zinc ribbon domain-containing protein [Gemmatimonadota bacterium]